MRNRLPIPNLISSIGVTMVLLHLMIKSPSPKIIFVPFIICSSSMIGMSVAKIINKEKLQVVFHKLFVLGFLMFFVGFFIVANYINIRDKNYTMLIFSIPFWLAGIYMIKNKLSNKMARQSGGIGVVFPIVMSVLLVFIVLLEGVFLLFTGIKNGELAIIFFGMFFTMGAFAFVLAVLTLRGCFDKLKVDVLGLYVGVVLVIIGSGFIGLKFAETYSVLETIEAFGVWMIIPILMITVGIFQVIKCLSENKEK